MGEEIKSCEEFPKGCPIIDPFQQIILQLNKIQCTVYEIKDDLKLIEAGVLNIGHENQEK